MTSALHEAPLTEHGFLLLSSDVDKLKKVHVELCTIFANHPKEQDCQNRIKHSLDEERIEGIQIKALYDYATQANGMDCKYPWRCSPDNTLDSAQLRLEPVEVLSS